MSGRPTGPPRRRPTPSTQRLDLLVFVEGERTEAQYVTHWHRLYRDHVLIEIDPFTGDPLSLVEHAIEAQREEARDARRQRGRQHDQIWCVFDRDEHPRFQAAQRCAEDNGIEVAISNPCIELWFCLHFEDQTAYIERDAAQRLAREKLLCGKALSPDALQALTERYPDAMARARRLDRKHAGDRSAQGANPSSSMWRLIEAIRSSDGSSAPRPDGPFH
jgi:hypothetical protein